MPDMSILDIQIQTTVNISTFVLLVKLEEMVAKLVWFSIRKLWPAMFKLKSKTHNAEIGTMRQFSKALLFRQVQVVYQLAL